jgi:hypothetical protein
MFITLNNFKDHIGEIVQSPEDVLDYTNKYILIPKGTYLILHRSKHIYDLYEIINREIVSVEPSEVDCSFQMLPTPLVERLELATEGLIKLIVQLASEGWGLGTGDLNLAPYFDLLEVYQRALDVKLSR